MFSSGNVSPLKIPFSLELYTQILHLLCLKCHYKHYSLFDVTLLLIHLVGVLQQDSLSSNPRTAIPGWKSEWFLPFCVIAIFIQVELIHFTLNSWTEAENVQYAILTQAPIPPERHDLAISTINFWCEGPSALYRGSQLRDRMTGNRLDLKSGTFLRIGTQLCSVLVTSPVLLEIQQALGW
jgi:hypothetical protein